MATYTELFNLANNVPLRERVQVACTVAAETIRVEPAPDPVAGPVGDAQPSPEYLAYQEEFSIWNKRRNWAAKALREPQVEMERMIWPVLAQNRSATAAQITGATDAALQDAVDDAVNVFAQTE